MRIGPKWGWRLAFAAVFAVAAACVFWGTWSPDFVPVMPDARTNFPSELTFYWRERLAEFMARGLFVPDDLKVFLLSPWFWVELNYVFAAFMAAAGMAFFLRGRGLSPLAAGGAGLFLAFSGYWLTLFSAGHLGWFRWMTYGVFAFGFADRAIRSGSLRHFALLGATVAWGSFYQPDLWLLFTLVTIAYFLWACARERRLPWRGTLVAIVVFAAVGLPSFYDAFANSLKIRDEQVASSLGEPSATEAGAADPAAAAKAAEERWIFATNWSLPPDETAELFRARLHGDTSCVFTRALARKAGKDVRPYDGALGREFGKAEGNYRQHSLYVGLVTCLFALAGLVLGLWRRAHRGEIVFFTVVAVFCWLFSLGRNCEGVYRLVYALPFGDYLRAPVKWHHLTEFALVVLAGYGVDSILHFARGRRWVVAVVAAVTLVGVFDLVRVDRLYCAPVDMTAARAKNADMQLTFIRADALRDPQVTAMLERGLIVSEAYHPDRRDVYIVGVLTPRSPLRRPEPLPPWTGVTTMGILSVIASSAVLLWGAWPCARRLKGSR